MKNYLIKKKKLKLTLVLKLKKIKFKEYIQDIDKFLKSLNYQFYFLYKI